jgi:hypothetical protein
VLFVVGEEIGTTRGDVIAGVAEDYFVFVRLFKMIVIPGRATWRGPGIHTPDGGYGFRARESRPGTTAMGSKKPAAISDGRLIFGVQQVLRPLLDATLTELDHAERRSKRLDEVT